MNILRRPRTHPIWKELALVKSDLPPISKIFAPCAKSDPEFYKSIVLLEKIENDLEEEQRKGAELDEQKALDKENSEPNWVFWERTHSATIDVAHLRERTLYPSETDAEREQRLRDKAEADKLNAWLLRLREKIIAGETAELKQNYEDALKSATNEEEQEALKRGLEKEINRLPTQITRKLRLLANIEAIDYSEPVSDEYPPLPNKVVIKNYYEIDFDIAPKDKERLLRWNVLLSKELDALNTRLNAELHLKRTKEWDEAHATNNEQKRAAEIRFDLLNLFSTDVPNPLDFQERMWNRVATEYVQEKQPGFQPHTRSQLVDAVKTAGVSELERRLEDMADNQFLEDLALRREKYPNSPLNVYLESLEDFVELSWDSLTASLASHQDIVSKLNFAIAKMEYRKKYWPIDFEELKRDYPDLVEELRFRVKNYYWNVDAPLQACVDDDHEWNEVRKIAWSKLLFREYKESKSPVAPVFIRPRRYAFPDSVSKNESL